MTSPTPAYPELWRVSHANLLDEGPESSSEARSPSSPSPYPEIVSSASWNAHEDLNLVIRLEATDLERKELSGDSMPSVSADDVLDSKLTGGGPSLAPRRDLHLLQVPIPKSLAVHPGTHTKI